MNIFKRVKSLFAKKVTNKSDNQQRLESVNFLSGMSQQSYYGPLYSNPLVRACVDKLATLAASTPLTHIRGLTDDFTVLTNSNINKLLTTSPNKNMTAYELQYKAWTDLFLNNNSYEYIIRDNTGVIKEIIPIAPNSVEVKEWGNCEYYVFYFDRGKSVISVDDIVHVRRFWHDNDYFGAGNGVIRKDIQMVENVSAQVEQNLKNASLKGFFQYKQNVSPEDIQAYKNEFIKSYLNAEETAGFGMIDDRFTITAFQNQSAGISVAQMNDVRNNIYRYYGLNDDVMLNNCSDDKLQVLYKAVIEPLMKCKCQQYSRKLFSQKELDNGNRIVSNIRQIKSMEYSQKINLVKMSLDGGLYSINEIRAWFGDAPIEGGDRRQTSLNFEKMPESNKNVATEVQQNA